MKIRVRPGGSYAQLAIIWGAIGLALACIVVFMKDGDYGYAGPGVVLALWLLVVAYLVRLARSDPFLRLDDDALVINHPAFRTEVVISRRQVRSVYVGDETQTPLRGRNAGVLFEQEDPLHVGKLSLPTLTCNPPRDEWHLLVVLDPPFAFRRYLRLGESQLLYFLTRSEYRGPKRRGEARGFVAQLVDPSQARDAFAAWGLESVFPRYETIKWLNATQ